MPRYKSIPELIESYKSRFIPENAKGVDTVIQLKLSGVADSEFYMMIKDQECTINEGAHESPVLIVNASADDWLKLNNGEANPMMLMMQGKLKVEGPLQMATKFQTLFRQG